MKFSVVIPVHNAEKYIEECLKSITSQDLDSCGSQVEILLIENGSTDNSLMLCDKLAEGNTNVKTFHFGKIGAYNARQQGIRKSTGDYIIFVDADDQMAEGSIGKLADYILSLQEIGELPDIVIYNAADLSKRDSKMFAFTFEENKIYKDEELDQFYEIMCKGDSLNALWNKCIKTETALLCISSEEDKNEVFNHGEDLLQTAAFLDQAKSMAYLNDILYYYRDNRQGLTGTYHREFLDNQVKAWEAFDDYAAKWTGDKFKAIIDERKTLTCMICADKLVKSEVSGKVLKKEIRALLDSDFFKRYGYEKLPEWAPESSVYMQKLVLSADPYKKLVYEGYVRSFKAKIKRLLKR